MKFAEIIVGDNVERVTEEQVRILQSLIPKFPLFEPEKLRLDAILSNFILNVMEGGAGTT